MTPERHLFGSWHGAGGDWTLRFGSDKSAVMETGLTKHDGKSIDWRRGTIAVQRGAWTLRVKDIDRREYTYGILSLGPEELNLIDNSGVYIRFFRTHDTVQKALVGRWLGPGSDYTLILNSERFSTLEIGVGQGFTALSEVRAGIFSMHDGFWTLTVRKVDATKNEPGPAHTYAVISHTPYEMSLVDSKGNVLKFHRLGEPFESLTTGLGQQ